ncbi:hypothetical protein [Sphingobacterium daejeonense]|nr:hypothetical protein [Sphingobacterium daejeonense]VTQ08151.1 Uncharacterised protein [Sphingobacterium daejeonense]
MNNQTFFEFSVDKENKTIHIKREFDANLSWYGKHGLQLQSLNNG